MKILRIFVESVLRYGLPANFSAFVLKARRTAPREYSARRPCLTGARMYGTRGGGDDGGTTGGQAWQ